MAAEVAMVEDAVSALADPEAVADQLATARAETARQQAEAQEQVTKAAEARARAEGMAEQLRTELAVLRKAHEVDVNRARRETAEALTARHQAELASVRAQAGGQVALVEARAEGVAELTTARAEEIGRLVSQLAELRANPASQSTPVAPCRPATNQGFA